MDQPKIERLLRLMMMLTNNKQHTIASLAKTLDMSERTIYRYISTFRESGFIIKQKDEFFRIDKSSPYFKDISELVHFSDEEAYILNTAINSIDDTNMVKRNLKKKLSSIYDYKLIAEVTSHPKNQKNIGYLYDAMVGKQQVVLENYCSSSSNKTSDRLVEPYDFTTNMVQVWCFEPSSGCNKLFNTARIGTIKKTNKCWQHEKKHSKNRIDIFRISSDKNLHIKLELNSTAKNLLIEEYPLSEKQITESGENSWILETDVCSYVGVGRFILGLFHDITILESDELKQYIREQILSMV